ncbi:hypothetical protein EYZ11_011474 [Aspergillus tanneri]|uniref:Uncharacterized protein n=1 Tax=Aspergillus tanneri TaxID=1220188 RepID=A0A4S3J329_9EURO|nr:uncharacterized protein ATNIH1004_011577 [Aspergillus tanneri]KAA8642632.1 hypothetical protein ATNIH1004_011577 [Aspergillus tanneri]THC89085.1 hypothetical protein EYZ11_011474 [Aspergillus tanneri]
MASRAFSTGARRMKKLDWKLKGTSVDVTWLTEQMDDSIDQVPGLESVVSGQVNGNPHPTPGNDDPYHGSVELYNQAGQRLTSAHCYPNGYVKFSKENKYKPVKLPPHPKAPAIPPAGPTTSKPDSQPTQSDSKSGLSGKK